MFEITLGTDAPGILRSVHAFVTDEAGGVWDFEVVRYIKDINIEQTNIAAGTVVVRDAMFAKDSNSVFSERGATPVPLSIRIELAKNFEQVVHALYAEDQAT